VTCDAPQPVLKRLFISIGVPVLLMFGVVADTSASESARLFMAQKNGHTAFFLPVTHKSSTVEMDGYLQRVVAEVLRRSTVLYDESAPKWQVYHYGIAACPTPSQFPGEVTRQLDPIFHYITRHDDYRFHGSEYLQEREFVKLMFVLLGPVDSASQMLPVQFEHHAPPVATVLAARFGIERRSIEGMRHFHQSYCALTVEERTAAVKTAIQWFGMHSEFAKVDPSVRYQGWLHCIKFSLRSLKRAGRRMSNACDNLLGKSTSESMWKFLIGHRNAYWLEEIRKISEAPSIPFYALGAQHFIDSSQGPGLLSLLAQSGFQVSVVETLSDLPHAVLRGIPASTVAPEYDIDTLKLP
jgi:hypothetical protein